MSTPSIWPTLSYSDAHAAVRFLTDVFGFTVFELHTDPADESLIVHAELRWPEGTGAVMLSSHGTGGAAYRERVTGNDSVYVACADPDALFERAVAAGATVVRPLTDEDYGSRGFVVRDPEGNLWGFGTYSD